MGKKRGPGLGLEARSKALSVDGSRSSGVQVAPRLRCRTKQSQRRRGARRAREASREYLSLTAGRGGGPWKLLGVGCQDPMEPTNSWVGESCPCWVVLQAIVDRCVLLMQLDGGCKLNMHAPERSCRAWCRKLPSSGHVWDAHAALVDWGQRRV